MEVLLPDQQRVLAEILPRFISALASASLLPALVLPITEAFVYSTVEDVVNRTCSNPSYKFTLDIAAREYLYLIINGQPGATDALIRFIFRIWMSHSMY